MVSMNAVSPLTISFGASKKREKKGNREIPLRYEAVAPEGLVNATVAKIEKLFHDGRQGCTAARELRDHVDNPSREISPGSMRLLRKHGLLPEHIIVISARILHIVRATLEYDSSGSVHLCNPRRKRKK